MGAENTQRCKLGFGENRFLEIRLDGDEEQQLFGQVKLEQMGGISAGTGQG